ncbi:patatin-domain-containing protein [Violaceomyces palustris]|uniref:Patatin-domain-containing protein n=1 Tax=Violaceomyces palustris TaxID=1673888 RepID=A0ACD0NPI1_9BASI|nr:patatin-domain-containing protein [Violaceomyces palustris]
MSSSSSSTSSNNQAANQRPNSILSRFVLRAKSRQPNPIPNSLKPLETKPTRALVPTTTSSPSSSKRRKSLSSILSPREEFGPPFRELDPLLTAEYCVPEHVAAFAEALREDLGQQENAQGGVGPAQITGSSTWSLLGFGGSQVTSGSNTPREASSSEPTATQASNPRKVGRIAAASDFAPVRERTSKRRRRGIDSGSREGFVYHTARWPLLIGIFVTIFLEFALYVFIRQVVNVIEYAIAWRGKKGVLRNKMRSATTHAEWKEAALQQDDFLGYEKWKEEDASGLYDWILVKKVAASLRSFREKDDAENLLGVLDLCLRNNFAGTENFRLYSETFYGTKYLIEGYLAEIEASLKFLEETEKVPLETKRAFYKNVSRNLGRSALCLSGGGSFGYYHVGVVKALLDAKLLPRVVTGTSAGGLIAALTCTRTDEELQTLLCPALADRITACEEPIKVWAKRAWKTGARFDTVKWAEKAAFFTLGSMTFREAHARTGKILCVSVIPSDRHSPVKLLNYITAPDCIIWSSLLASAAVPGILNPVCLMQKKKDGSVVPWNWGHRFKDGSLRVDIPLQDLHSLFNVNYPIVSQVNPHVHLFHFGSKGAPGRPTAHRKGKGWRGGFVLSASEHVLKLHLKMNFKIIRDLDLLPAILGQDWSSVFLQPFGGAVTIWPKTRFWDWVRILSDPDRKELARMMRVGQSVTFPKIHMIENRVRLEKAVERGRKLCRQAIRARAKAQSRTSWGTSRPDSASGAEDLGTSSRFSREEAESMRNSNGPLTAASLPSDTDLDDFFSSKKAFDRMRVGVDTPDLDETRGFPFGVEGLPSTGSNARRAPPRAGEYSLEPLQMLPSSESTSAVASGNVSPSPSGPLHRHHHHAMLRQDSGQKASLYPSYARYLNESRGGRSWLSRGDDDGGGDNGREEAYQVEEGEGARRKDKEDEESGGNPDDRVEPEEGDAEEKDGREETKVGEVSESEMILRSGGIDQAEWIGDQRGDGVGRSRKDSSASSIHGASLGLEEREGRSREKSWDDRSHRRSRDATEAEDDLEDSSSSSSDSGEFEK